MTIRLLDGNQREILNWLANGDVDLAIMGRPPDEFDVDIHAFASHPTVLIAAPARIPSRSVAASAWSSWPARPSFFARTDRAPGHC